MVNILYNDLITLINNSQLVTEEQYRITDYVTTVSKAYYTSEGYKFDIVVTALTADTLYEYATLMPNASETYFDNNDLSLFNVKYNVHNVIPGYSNDWVDANGKGCIYYMVDDKGNEAPYDFKNIKSNGEFLFNDFNDYTDTSQTVSTYNSVKEVVEDGYYKLPSILFDGECHNVRIGINAKQVIVGGCSNLQMGDNCKNCELLTVNDALIGDELSYITLISINGCEIGDNNSIITAQNQTNLIIKDNNSNIRLYGGSNGIIIDSNNTDITIGTNAQDIYINASKVVNLGNNAEQFNISSSYDVRVEDNCQLFTLNKTNYLTATNGCQSINTTKNSYLTLTEEVKNVKVSKGLTNLVLDGSKLTGTEAKVIVQQDEKAVVVNEQTNSEVVLTEDGTTTSNPNSFINDSPADGLIYGRKDGNWTEIDTSSFITDAPSDEFIYGRKGGDWEQIDTSGGGVSIISITWSDLKALRDAGTLAPGQIYRITDYVCTTTTANSRAVNNLFDIIVIALDENHLSENAGATYHAGDTYFSSNNAKLESWELKYCLDNDTNRFAWADTENGKGVIYYMKDDKCNECFCDFKNIQYLKNEVWLYTFGGETDNSVVTVYDSAVSRWFYNAYNSIGVNYNFNNRILKLSFNTFGSNCIYNTLGDGCWSNTFGSSCYSNTFGDRCYSNTFGIDCDSNTFGNSCFSNTFGNRCHGNTFGYGCYSNTFGDGCNSNTFGDGCGSNIFYHGTSGTTKKDYIRYVVLEDGCRNNNFYSPLTTSYSSYLQRIRIKGLDNATPTDTIITLPTTNTEYEWVIAKNSSDVIKQYCPENLVT